MISPPRRSRPCPPIPAEKTTTEQKYALAQVSSDCWKDDALKARFMTDPKAVLKDHGLDVPDGVDVNVVESADDCVYITLPTPAVAHGDFSNDEPSNAAGGDAVCSPDGPCLTTY